MISRNLIAGVFVLASLVSSSVFAAEQTVVAAPSSFNVSPGDTVEFTVQYPASNPADATGLGLKIYFDSTKLTLTGTSNVFATNKLAESTGADSSNGDGDASTDQFINIAWVNFGGAWPAGGENLVTATFTTSAGFTSDTAINFTGDPSAGNTFASTPVTVALTVPDTTDPVVTAPANVTKEATGSTTAVTLGAATATDDVDGTLTATASPTGPFAVGGHTVTWAATDAAGNTGTDTQQVTITDTTPPVITVPADKTVTATGVNTPVDVGTATATDIVDGAVAVTSNSPGTFPLGDTTVTWTATDARGNTGTATQIVTITEAPVDETDPVVTAPADITKEATGPATAVTLGTATATDDVDGALTPVADISSPFPVGVTTVTWSATDSSGNTGNATQTVTITDTSAPIINVPPDVTVQLEDGETEASVDFGNATATDLVDGVVPVNGVNNADIGTFTVGTHVITWSASDSYGNTATATQRVIVNAFRVEAIPTLSEWGLILLSIMLAFVSWVGVGRKTKV